jgi:hypothetical protein
MTARSTTDDGADAHALDDAALAPDQAPTKVTRARATTSGRAGAPGVASDERPTRADRIVISQGGIYQAEADSISLHQGGMSIANAESIDITQGGIGRARAGGIAVSQGGVGLAQADNVSLERGFIGAAIGQETRLLQSMSNVVMGGETTVDQSLVGTMVSGSVTVRQPSAIGVLIAGRVEGSVRPILDWRGAIAFGAAYALVRAILRRGRR